MQLQRIRLISLSLLHVAVAACASQPEQPIVHSPVHAELATPTSSPGSPATSASGTAVNGSEPPERSDVSKPKSATIPFGPGMSRPVQIAGPSPSLPPKAIENHVTGDWIARCVMTEEGAIEECHVVKGLPYSDEHLLQILQAQRYTPVMFEGKPQRVNYTFKIKFK